MYFQIHWYFLCKNMHCFKATHIFSAKYINVFAIFQDRNFNISLVNNFVKFWTTGPRCWHFFWIPPMWRHPLSKRTSRCNVTTLQRRCNDVVVTLCVYWAYENDTSNRFLDWQRLWLPVCFPVGHSEPIVTGLLIGAKKCREARGSYFV